MSDDDVERTDPGPNDGRVPAPDERPAPVPAKKAAARAAPKKAAAKAAPTKAAAKAAPTKAASADSAVKRSAVKGAAGSSSRTANAPRKSAVTPSAMPATEGPATAGLGGVEPVDAGTRRLTRSEADVAAAITPSEAADRFSVLRALLLAARPRATRAQIVVAGLCALLGFGLVTQVRSAAGAGLSTARQSDLVDILDNLSARSEQLRSQIAAEQDALGKLTGGTDRTQAALDEATQRAATLQILAGTLGATGPGIELQIPDPGGSITAEVLLGTLEELRDAGAEAVEIRGAPSASSPAAAASVTPGGSSAPAASASSGTAGTHPAVRLVASSYFVDSLDGHGILVDGTLLMPPYDIYAIGDSHTMHTMTTAPGSQPRRGV